MDYKNKKYNQPNYFYVILREKVGAFFQLMNEKSPTPLIYKF